MFAGDVLERPTEVDVAVNVRRPLQKRHKTALIHSQHSEKRNSYVIVAAAQSIHDSKHKMNNTPVNRQSTHLVWAVRRADCCLRPT
jgi:hypothetical protein